MKDTYIYCILTKNNTINFVRFCNALKYENGDEMDFFNRSLYWDDIKLIVPFKYFFELLEKIKLNRIQGITVDQVLKAIERAEAEICMQFEMFDQEFVLSMIDESYGPYKDAYGNISNSLPFIISDKIDSIDKVIK